MATNIIHPGAEASRVQVTKASVSSGDVVVSGRILGIALTDTQADGTCVIDVGARATLPADTSTAFAVGGPVWWDVTNSECVAPGTADSALVGFATAAGGSSDPTQEVQMLQSLDKLYGVAQVDNGATTETVSHPLFVGRSGSPLAVSFWDSPGSAATVRASWSSNNIVITVDADPGANIKVVWMVL